MRTTHGVKVHRTIRSLYLSILRSAQIQVLDDTHTPLCIQEYVTVRFAQAHMYIRTHACTHTRTHTHTHTHSHERFLTVHTEHCHQCVQNNLCLERATNSTYPVVIISAVTLLRSVAVMSMKMFLVLREIRVWSPDQIRSPW